MPDTPLTCVYLITIGGEIVKVSVTSRLTLPLRVHFRVDPLHRPETRGPMVATWCRDEWTVFEGADPRPILGFAVDQGHVLCGPCPRDWPVVKPFLKRLAQAPALWRR